MFFDSNLQLKDAGLVAADAAGTVAGSAKVLDVGEVEIHGDVDIVVSALEIDSNNELYKIKLQGCFREDFAHGIEDLAILELGAKEVLGGDQDSGVGRYRMLFNNVKGGYLWRYLRIYTDVSGTIGTGINFTAHLSPIPKFPTCKTVSVLDATTTTTTA